MISHFFTRPFCSKMPKQLQIKNICRTCLLNYHMWESVTTCTLNSTYIVKFIVYSPNCKVKLMLHDIALDKLSVKEYEDPFRG